MKICFILNDFFLELSSGVNVVRGTNGMGKSNLIRALCWIFYNDGDFQNDILSDFAAQTWEQEGVWVEIEYPTGETIRRLRDGKFNGYILSGCAGKKDGTRVAMGKDRRPTPEIRELLEISEIDFDGQLMPINLQGQRGLAFLEGKSAPSISRQLAKLVGVDIFEPAIPKVKKDLDECNKEAEQKQLRVSQLDQEIAGFAYLPEYEATCTSTEENLKEVRVLETRFNAISTLFTHRQQLVAEKQQKEALLVALNERLVGLSKLMQELLEIQQRASSLQTVIEKKKQLSQLLAGKMQQAQVLEQKLPALKQLLLGLGDWKTKYKEMSILITGRKGLAASFAAKTAELQTANSQLEQAMQQRDSGLKSLGYCPTCLRKVGA